MDAPEIVETFLVFGPTVIPKILLCDLTPSRTGEVHGPLLGCN